jgi:hypothetical protein
VFSNFRVVVISSSASGWFWGFHPTDFRSDRRREEERLRANLDLTKVIRRWPQMTADWKEGERPRAGSVNVITHEVSRKTNKELMLPSKASRSGICGHLRNLRMREILSDQG